MDRSNAWITTYTGKQLHFLGPDAEEIDIVDIAHGLALSCRWGKQCQRFLSVAEHSWHASKLVPPELALEGLMHDACEAYLTDVPSPIKAYLRRYKEIEAIIQEAICKKFGVPTVENPLVKHADECLKRAESRLNMNGPLNDTGVAGHDLPDLELEYWCPETAEVMFLQRFEELTRAVTA